MTHSTETTELFWTREYVGCPGSFRHPIRGVLGCSDGFVKFSKEEKVANADIDLGGGWPNRAFGAGGNHRTHTSRPVAVRLLVIQAIKSLNSMSPSKAAPGFHQVSRLLQQVEQLKPPNEPSIQLNEMLDICDTEGNPQNGGGSFIVKEDDSHNRYVKFEPDSNSPMANHRVGLAPGDIGSPIPVSSIPTTFGGIGTGPSVRQFSPPTSF